MECTVTLACKLDNALDDETVKIAVGMLSKKNRRVHCDWTEPLAEEQAEHPNHYGENTLTTI